MLWTGGQPAGEAKPGPALEAVANDVRAGPQSKTPSPPVPGWFAARHSAATRDM